VPIVLGEVVIDPRPRFREEEERKRRKGHSYPKKHETSKACLARDPLLIMIGLVKDKPAEENERKKGPSLLPRPFESRSGDRLEPKVTGGRERREKGAWPPCLSFLSLASGAARRPGVLKVGDKAKKERERETTAWPTSRARRRRYLRSRRPNGEERKREKEKKSSLKAKPRALLPASFDPGRRG